MGRHPEWKLVWRNGWAYAHGRFKGEKIRHALKTQDPEAAPLLFARFVAPYQLQDRVEAERMVLGRINDAQESIQRSEHQDREQVTITDAAIWYNDHPEERPQALAVTLRDYKSQWKKFSEWANEHRPGVEYMRDISTEDTAAFARWLSRNGGLSNNRYKKVLSTCKRFYKYTLPHRPNPWTRIDVFLKNTKAIPNSRRPLSRAELQTVFTKATGELLTMVALGYYTGLRMGDCATLAWSEISFELNRITRQPNKTRRSSGKVVIIPLHQDLRRHLLLTPLAKQRGHVMPGMADQYKRDATRISRRLTRFFSGDCEIATTEIVEGMPRPVKVVDFHSLRHTFATESHRHGADQATLEALLGHGSPVLQRLYVHVGNHAIAGAIHGLPAIQPGDNKSIAIPDTPQSLLIEALQLENLVDIKERIVKALRLF